MFTCQIFHMPDNNNAQHPNCSTQKVLYFDIPHVRLYTHSLGFQMFQHVLFYSDSLPCISVTGQPISCKTRLRGNFQFSCYKYCNEALTLVLNISLIKVFQKKQKLFYSFCHGRNTNHFGYANDVTVDSNEIFRFSPKSSFLWKCDFNQEQKKSGVCKPHKNMKTVEKFEQNSAIVFNSIQYLGQMIQYSL